MNALLCLLTISFSYPVVGLRMNQPSVLDSSMKSNTGQVPASSLMRLKFGRTNHTLRDDDEGLDHTVSQWDWRVLASDLPYEFVVTLEHEGAPHKAKVSGVRLESDWHSKRPKDLEMDIPGYGLITAEFPASGHCGVNCDEGCHAGPYHSSSSLNPPTSRSCIVVPIPDDVPAMQSFTVRIVTAKASYSGAQVLLLGGDVYGSVVGIGDPHLTNINGQKFNIYQAGSVPLLKIGSNDAPLLGLPIFKTQLLEITGLIEHLGPSCHQHFFTEIKATGSWLSGKSISVRKNRLSSEPNDFIVDVNGNQTVMPRAGDGENVEYTLFHDVSAKSPFTIAFSASTEIRRSVKISMGHVTMQIEEHTGYGGFLNVFVRGLGSYADNAGGILGSDDHSHWSNRGVCKDMIEETSFLKGTSSEDEKSLASVASAKRD